MFKMYIANRVQNYKIRRAHHPRLTSHKPQWGVMYIMYPMKMQMDYFGENKISSTT